MSRFIYALPATAAAAAAAAAASANANRAPSSSATSLATSHGNKFKPERSLALTTAHPELLQIAPSIHETNNTLDTHRLQVVTRAPEGTIGEEAVAPSIKRRMPARFQLEDEDDSMQSLYNSRPPIGDATLRSGLGVEITTW